ncbi:hypothetical protein AB0H51_08445 [Streptomyces griseoluteus]|uniref:hypothetical protein n=1 Tax=Streptomyces griseoluteus TaxID=29306 RepID=UPI0033EDE700
MGDNNPSRTEVEDVPSFDAKTAEVGTLYRWDAESDEKCVMALRPAHINRFGVLADVYVLEDGQVREVNAQGMFLADGSGGYELAESIPMGRYTVRELQGISDEYARAAAFLRSVAQ